LVNSILFLIFEFLNNNIIMELPIGTFTLKECSPAIRKRVFEILKENNIPFDRNSAEYGGTTDAEYPYLSWSLMICETEEELDNVYDHIEFLDKFGLTYTEQETPKPIVMEQETQTTKPTIMEQTPFYKTAKEFDDAYSAKSEADKSFEEFLIKYNEMFEKKEYVYCIREDDMNTFLKQKLENAGFVVHKKDSKYGYIFVVSFREQLIEDYLEYSQIY